MASGVGVNPECLQAYQELKLGKKTNTYDDFLADLPEGECRWAVYDFDFEKEDGGKRSKITFYSWQEGERQRHKEETEIADDCCVIYATRLIALIRSPDDSKVKQKMLFASSKDALRRSLVGIAAEIQGTDFSEVAHESVLDKVSRGN
ncbi:hypothetical protein ONZ51_g9360 [Trametes cubensis]|uniref:Cofilin n=1 Tax=Trametes cubensis TaxID=1111947 RepID=A0AAD7X5Q2_9APHY|nr:hypothetical protein ONZ51_g9360 [Trametes cubensis]